MSEIKTIKGRVSFGCVPIPNDASHERIYMEGTVFVDTPKKRAIICGDVHEFGSCKILCKLSEITEEQASLLVEPLTYASSMYDDLDTDVIKPNKTAKESLFSLLKTNGCCIKEWIEKPNINEFKSIPFCESGECKAYFDEVSVWEKIPDDYLLIIKQ